MDQSQFAQTAAGLDALYRDFVDYREYVLAAPRAPQHFIDRLNGGAYHGHDGKIDCRLINMRGDRDDPKWCVIEHLTDPRFRAAGDLPVVLFLCAGTEPSEKDVERLHAGFVEKKTDFIRGINEGRARRKRLEEQQRQEWLEETTKRLNFYWAKSVYDMKQEAWRGRMARQG